MAHELTIREDGKAEAFYAGNGIALNPAWHGLGQNIIGAANSEQAMELGLLKWKVLKVAAGAEDMGGFFPAPDFRAIIREDNHRVLGFVTDKYVPVQNDEAFAFMDGLNQDGITKYESAGSLKGGKVVWVLARTGSVFEVAPGDAVQPYLLFSTSHDGSASIRVQPTTVRVVCQNTLTIALGKAGVGLTLKHDGTVHERLAAVREIIAHAQGKVADKFDEARKLVAKRLEKTEFQKFVDEVLPPPAEDNERPGLRLKARELVAWNFYSNPRQNLPGIERTAWAAYNAVSEFADHSAKFRTTESRFTSVIEGGANDLKQKAFDTALSLV